MNCMPQSGKCERHLTDPFVIFRNSLRSASFAHEACLDQIHRNSKQPETLYRDASNRALVVERKCVMWPIEYAAKHQSDHRFVQGIADSLSNVANGRHLTVDLSDLSPLRGLSRADRLNFVEDISEQISNSIAAIENGGIVECAKHGIRWNCRNDELHHVSNGHTGGGVMIEWAEAGRPEIPPTAPRELREKMSEIFLDCVGKFMDYPTATRALLLEPFGLIRNAGNAWWAELCSLLDVPPGIDEVWLSIPSEDEDNEKGRQFEQIHP